MSSEFEKRFAALITEIGDIEADLTNSGKVRERLVAVKQGIESLYTQSIAERHRNELTESSLQESESYNKILFQQSRQAIVVFDPEARCFIDSNQAAAQIFGYSSPEEIVGKTPLDMAAPTQYDGTDSAVASQRRDQSALVQGIESFEWRHRRPNGEIWDAMVHLMAFNYRGRRLLQATLEDITERRKTEEDHRKSRQLLESVLENSPAVIYAKRKDGRYTYINREWERVCDLRREQVIGRTDHDLFPPEIAEQFRTNDLAVLQTGRLTESEERVGTPWGEQLFLSKKVPLISIDGEVEGLCGISTNITDQRRNELDLREAIMTLERERENKLMNVEAIIASIAHEVRQPLTAITANAAAALRFFARTPPDFDEINAALSRVVSDSHRASEVLDGIRALFQKVGQAREAVDLNEITREALQLLQGELTDHGVTTRTEFASELPHVQGHRGQLQEIMINLCHNAIEAMATMTDQNRLLRIRTGRYGEKAIAVAVEDSGPGIDPKQLQGIFDAFVTTKAQGMGLGLAICRRIIESHGGQISALSDGKSGALFQFVLPIQLPDGDANATTSGVMQTNP
ncbi:MAG: PAS domain-containing protein [Xanthobacteraceae bacterium]